MGEGANWWVIVGAVLTWLIFILGIAQLSRFYLKFMELRRESDAHMLSLEAQLKKLQASLAEIIIEQRRATRLQVEQLDLKKAEMTGDFEIVEEPIPAPQQQQVLQPTTPKIMIPEEK